MADREHGAIGCIYATEDALAAAVVELGKNGVVAQDIRVGARDPLRARSAGERCGIRADLSSDDPLADLGDSEQGDKTRPAIDKAGVLGAFIGALVGFGLGLTPARSLMPVPAYAATLALSLFFFVLGAIAGSVIGGAFAPQPSTHAGFRLIDGMEEGGLAVIVQTTRSQLDAVQTLLETAGATGITRL